MNEITNRGLIELYKSFNRFRKSEELKDFINTIKVVKLQTRIHLTKRPNDQIYFEERLKQLELYQIAYMEIIEERKETK